MSSTKLLDQVICLGSSLSCRLLACRMGCLAELRNWYACVGGFAKVKAGIHKLTGEKVSRTKLSVSSGYCFVSGGSQDNGQGAVGGEPQDLVLHGLCQHFLPY